ELDYLQMCLRESETMRAMHTIRRMLTILKTVVAQVDVMETMTPLEFNSFRAFLESASGFQSGQFREIEFALGYKRANILAHYPEDRAGRAKTAARYAQPPLWDAFLHYLSQAGYPIPAGQLNRDVTRPLAPAPEVQAILIEAYQTNPAVRTLCERLV